MHLALNSLLFPFNMKQIPFDKITECYVVEPSRDHRFYNLSKVLVHVSEKVVVTADNQDPQPSSTFSFTGLKDPKAFQKLVLAMKRLSRQNCAPNVTAV